MMTINKIFQDNTADPYDATTAPRKSLGLYLHVPFCIKKCNYCDFLSFGTVSEEQYRAYFSALIREIKAAGEVYGKIYYVDTIFIGGGTPSLVPEDLIAEVMVVIGSNFSVDANAEITIETNPKTLTERKLRTYLNAGINRLSIGAQTLDDSLLRSLGRAHSREDFLKNYDLARTCGFRNINIDLMFAIPGQTMELWMDTLMQAIKLSPEHLSFYSLQIEEGTPFYSMVQEGALKETDEGIDRDMYHEAVRELKEHGYDHYEISNAAKPGFYSRHNLKYWSMEDYLGLGLGAHSFLDGTRFSNITDLNQYGKIDPVSHWNSFHVWQHQNTREENISEYLFTGLRKIHGIKPDDFQARFGTELEYLYGGVLKRYQGNGLLEIVDGTLRFTERGIDLSNTVLTEFV